MSIYEQESLYTLAKICIWCKTMQLKQVIDSLDSIKHSIDSEISQKYQEREQMRKKGVELYNTDIDLLMNKANSMEKAISILRRLL